MSTSSRRAFTIAETIIGLALFALLLGMVVWIFGFGSRTLTRLLPGLDLQKSNRRAVVRLLGEIQEGMEVIAPVPGSTLSYAVIADKTGQLKFFHQLPDRNAPGFNTLWVHAEDGARREQIVHGVRRLTFTSLGEGALVVNLVLSQDGTDSPVYATIRLRNLAAAEEVW